MNGNIIYSDGIRLNKRTAVFKTKKELENRIKAGDEY